MSVVLTATYGWTVERLAYRPLRGSSRLAPLISAIGMSIFLQNYVQLLQGARNKPLQPIISGGLTVMEGNGFAVQLSYLQIVIMVVRSEEQTTVIQSRMRTPSAAFGLQK